MAKALPIEHYREKYRGHQERAGRFGIAPKEFNARVLKRFRGATPYPQMWSSYAYLEVQSIAGHRCCPSAESNPCCCDESWACGTHGYTHVGRHD
jgi:hypothetical protein